MNITILCSSREHPVNAYLKQWANDNQSEHQVHIARKLSDLKGGDFLFLVSCSEIVKTEHRALYKYSLVLHASDLPKGRGWSPHIWEVVNGADYITLSLLEVEDSVDSGRIWIKKTISVQKTDLWKDVNKKLFQAEINLINEAVNNCDSITPYDQDVGVTPTYYKRRTPANSELDPDKTIAEQFDLMRMCDPERYPAWFEYSGQKYKISLEKVDHEET